MGWGIADEYLEKITKEQQENDIEYWKNRCQNLIEALKKANEKIEKVQSAVIRNCRPKEDIVKEVYEIVIPR